MSFVFHEQDGQNSPPYIQYSSLALDLFGDSQKVVPFLGAGASLGGVPATSPGPSAPERQPTAEQMDAACEALGLTKGGYARLFLEVAVSLASRFEQGEQVAAGTAFQRAQLRQNAPSAGELAEVFAELSQYDYFDRPATKLSQLVQCAERQQLAQLCRAAAAVSGVASLAPPLLSVASFYSYTQRATTVLNRLQSVFANVKAPTPTHELVACMAAHYMKQPSADYLIVTTNYDCLIENALDSVAVPFCAIAVNKEDSKVDVRFSGSAQTYLGLDGRRYSEMLTALSGKLLPDNFYIQKAKPLVIVYKMHGCLYIPTPGRDSIILSDEDYVGFLRRNGPTNAMLPAHAKRLMDGKSFLFLGYSFSDWDVRGWYQLLDNQRSQTAPDHAVTYHLDPYESGYFQAAGINVVVTQLNRFAERIREYAPSEAPCAVSNAPGR